MRDRDEEPAAAAHIGEQRLVLLLGGAVPPREDEGAVAGEQLVRIEIPLQQAHHVHLPVRRAGEEEVGIGAEHVAEREEHLPRQLPAAFGDALEPAGIAVGQRVGARDGVVGHVAVAAEVEAPLHQRQGRLGLAGGRAVRLDEIVEVGDFAAVAAADGRRVVDRPVVLTSLLDEGRELRFAASAPGHVARLQGHVREAVPRRILAERRLDEPVAAFVDDHLAAGHVLLKAGGAQQRELPGAGVGKPRIVLVREMRPPHRQLVLAEQSPRKRRGQVEVAEREVLDNGDVRPRVDFVVDVEVRAGGHDRPPPLGALPLHVLAHPRDQILRQILQRDRLDVAPPQRRAVEGEAEALAEVVPEVESADLREPPHPLVPRIGVDESRVDPLRGRRLHEAEQTRTEALGMRGDVRILPVVQAGQRLPVGVRDVDADLVERVLPFGVRARGIAPVRAPDLGQIALIVFHDLREHLQRMEALRHPGLVADQRAEQVVLAHPVDAAAHPHPAGGKRGRARLRRRLLHGVLRRSGIHRCSLCSDRKRRPGESRTAAASQRRCPFAK